MLTLYFQLLPFLPLVLQGPSHQTSSTTTSGSNVNTNTPSPGPYVSDQYGMYTARLT